MTIRPFALERYLARWEFAAPYTMCSSDLETLTLPDLLALADDDTLALWNGLSLGYTEPAGHPLLRQQIAGLYSSLNVEDVYTFAGAEEAIYVLFHALLTPADHVIAFWPGYQSLYEVARSTGADVTLLPLTMESGWRPDLAMVRRAIRPNTRLIIVNTPHNPTGAHLPHAEWDTLIGLAQEADAYLLGDEVYRFSEYDPADRLSAVADAYEKGISLGVMSKAFGLAGLRVGWLATRDPSILERASGLKDYTTICNSAPSEILAIIALRAKERILARTGDIIRENLALLDTFLARHTDQLAWVRPQAGGIGFPRLLTGEPISEFADRLIREQGVLLLPGTVYDDPPTDLTTGNHFRIGFGRANFPEALSRFEQFLNAPR